MDWQLEGTSIPHPSDIGNVLRTLAPEICHSFDNITRVQEYCWDSGNGIKEIRAHPRQEMLAKFYCSPPPFQYVKPATWELRIDPQLPEYEIQFIYNDDSIEILKVII